MDYTCCATIRENMLDFGCDESVIEAFIKCFEENDRKGQKAIIEACRRTKIDELHQKQKEIDLLDYMVYQMEKCNC